MSVGPVIPQAPVLPPDHPAALPSDVLQCIAEFVTIPDLGRMARVCRHWNQECMDESRWGERVVRPQERREGDPSVKRQQKLTHLRHEN